MQDSLLILGEGVVKKMISVDRYVWVESLQALIFIEAVRLTFFSVFLNQIVLSWPVRAGCAY